MNIKEQLQKGDVEFTVKNLTTYSYNEKGVWGDNLKIFKVSTDAGAINAGYNGMNVKKWGPTCVTLYTFDMLGKKSVGKINYSQITLIK